MRKVMIAATQMKCGKSREKNIETAEKLIRAAAAAGANIILLQELFETPYFCQKQDFKCLQYATYPEENPAIRRLRELARELDVVIPVSFFEKTRTTSFNSVCVVDAGGEILGIYRKTHIPDGMPYAEKFYFTPGDTGFKVWNTKFGTIGVGICWDQWFPEAARIMALMGAEILFYPTAIGSEPVLGIDSKGHWQRCMQGHAAANIVPVVASNRIGKEIQGDSEITFFGSSFIADETGDVVKQCDREAEGFVTAEFDLDMIEKRRREWGIFRDRRPEMYETILTRGV